MRKFLLVLLFPAIVFGAANVTYDTATHKVTKPPVVTGKPDYDYTGLNVVGLAGGPGPGGGTPGGVNLQFQYNNNFTFGGVPYILFNGTAVTQQVGARYILLDPTDNTKRVQIALANPTATLKTLTISDDSVTVIPGSPTPNQFVTNVNTLGVVVKAQPLFSDIGGLLPLSQTTQNTGKLLGRYSAGTGNTQEITVGANLTLTGAGVLNAAASGTGTPGGVDTQFQYNNSSVFDGTSNLVLSGGQVKAVDANFLFKNISDATKQMSFNLAGVTTGTTVTAIVPPGTTTPVLVKPDSGAANNFLTGIGSTGIISKAQVDFTNISGVIALGQQNIPIAKERFVDPINGSDITGAANLAKPYLTIAAACAAASSGDVIYLYPNLTGYDQSTTSLVIPAGVTLVGAGPDTTVIKGAATPRAVVEPSTGSAVYNVTIQNTSATGVGYGVLPASSAFTSAYIGGTKVIANSVGIEVAKTGSTGLVGENLTVVVQGDCLYQDATTAVSVFRNCSFVSDGTTTTASRGLDVINGTVRYNYGDITVGNSTNTNLGVRADGAATVVELHGVRISNSGGGTTNNDVRQTSSAILGVDNVIRPDAGPLVTSGTITQLSRYALRDNNLSDFPNLGSGTRGDIIYRGATGWTKLGAGLDGNVLTTHGTTADPEWLTGGGPGGSVSDLAFGATWNGQTTTGSSQNALYDYFHLLSPSDNGKVGVLDIGAGIPKTDGTGLISLAVAGTDYTSPTGVEALSNKRIMRRQQSVVAPTPAPVIATDNFDTVHYTGITGNLTSISTSGTPQGSDTLIFDFTDDGTARTIAWDTAKFESSPGQVLPTTTTASTRMDVGFRWNPVTSKWRCLASSNAVAISGAGTVTSVGASGSNGVTVGGVPITSTGTISIGLPITLAGTAGKTLTVNNSLTLAGTDGSTLNVGAGGTLGTNAFNSTAFLTASNISNAPWSATMSGDTTTAPSRDAVYNWGHTFDTNDDGLPDKVGVTGPGLLNVSAGNVLGLATAGTDYTNLAFKTVSVAGQSDVVADTAGDVLTLAAGSNVTLTTTPGTDTVTIAATGGSGSVSITGTSPIVLTPSPTTGTGVVSLNVGVDHAFTAAQTIALNNVTANGISTPLTLIHNTTGTPADNIGTGLIFQGETSTTISQPISQIDAVWQTDADASRFGYLEFKVTDISLSGSPQTKLRIFGDGGITNNNTTSVTFTSPGAGIINSVTGFKLGGAEFPIASNGIVKRTAANTYAVAVAADMIPGGSNTQVQFNNSSAFSGISNATTDGTTMTLTSPKVVTNIKDTNANTLLGIGATTSAVNNLKITNAASGGSPVLGAEGSGTNIDITTQPKGTGWSLFNSTFVASLGLPVSSPGWGLGIGVHYSQVYGEVDFYNAYATGGTNPQFKFLNGTPTTLLDIGVTGIAVGPTAMFQFSPTASAATMGTIDTALARNAAGIVEINNGTAGSYRDLICRNITISGGNFTGRINPRASGGCDETTSTTSTPTSDSCDQWDITALASTDTFVAPSGTPVNGQSLIIRIKDNGTAQTLSFPTASSGQYRFSTDMPAPTTTVISKTFYIGFKWNAAASRWDNVAQMNNF